MTYRISGLSREPFSGLFALSDTELAARNAVRVTATTKPGFQCRISLEEAEIGEELILLNHTHHDVETPYRSDYAIYVRDGVEPATFVDRMPPMLLPRHLALRGFSADGTLLTACLTAPGDADAKVRDLFAADDIAYIHVHNAAHGCFAARIDRT